MAQNHNPMDLHTNGVGVPVCNGNKQLWQEFFPAATSIIPLIVSPRHLWTTSSEDKPGNDGSRGLQMQNEAKKL